MNPHEALKIVPGTALTFTNYLLFLEQSFIVTQANWLTV